MSRQRPGFPRFPPGRHPLEHLPCIRFALERAKHARPRTGHSRRTVIAGSVAGAAAAGAGAVAWNRGAAAMPGVLSGLSDVLPLSYAVDAMTAVATQADAAADVWRDVAVMAGFVVAAIALGAATLRRRTP